MDDDSAPEFTLPLEADPQYQLIVSSNRLVQGACLLTCVCVYIYIYMDIIYL
jgi:hypothetical protein